MMLAMRGSSSLSSDWPTSTLGGAVAAGKAITVWCDNRACD
jgi:hypothetical protein